VLDATKARIVTTRLSKSDPLSEKDVRALLKEVNEIVVAKGKSARTLPAREATLDDLRGPTGNFRAPMVRIGRRLLVGFHEETLRKELGAR
jgi:arsenate reductase-like glutaredoxin family protein